MTQYLVKSKILAKKICQLIDVAILADYSLRLNEEYKVNTQTFSENRKKQMKYL